ncbi:tannase/feruloyl esterase family alpha/beta hydrolase [Bradyrhizobium jicamae]|uniref:Tannase/feruloyl esterase family alpha/beta hydrolase n=1 Tax=Bradyrhizobium jicamae TaxID=280332 RepID=A0ABS5FJQ8_9BRAD|nr:tannase/feruloyl esterase family alpha/beta hydrolase [Bradyrhizobium jicamae]MBR0797016.1 tannase/feruloyl esterase family alpha/beta hydrolase [Bradyrhizobium jicamae]MBR0937112.1 tannase/feruloyl esterase family alpha/beta hydrolase [Bradyrhizobium jicamae]
MRKQVVAVGLCLAVTTPMLLSRSAQAGTPLACEQLAGLKIDNVNLLSSTRVEATADLPAHCRVLGYVRPAINFEIRLPVEGWNGKFYMTGCGGFCGTLDSDRAGFTNSMNFGLRRNYAASTMDSGHWGTSVLDGRWAYNNRLAEIDWGSRAVTETAKVTKAIIRAYYGDPQKKSYFIGCSTGGRMAALEAQRFPDDFDGIISGAPALDYTGLVATHFAWLVQANTGPDGKDILSKSKVPLIRDAVAKQCGDATGLVTDPAACKFEPASLICKPGQNSDCLSEAEARVVEKWYGGAKNSKGEQVYPGGLPKGSEPYWPVWLTGLDPAGGKLIYGFGLDFLRYMAFQDDPGERYKAADFDFDKDPPRLAHMAAIYNAMNPDLSRFKARGGKLLMYHGLADPIVTPQNTLDYYAAAEKAAGGNIADTFRLFMIPGMDHCGIPGQAGPGITEAGFDPVSALEKWVEDGVAPDTLVATKTDKEGKVLWTRPLCPYPRKATFAGTGDIKDAANYRCE